MGFVIIIINTVVLLLDYNFTCIAMVTVETWDFTYLKLIFQMISFQINFYNPDLHFQLEDHFCKLQLI